MRKMFAALALLPALALGGAGWAQEVLTVVADEPVTVVAEEPALLDQITDDLVDLVVIIVGGALTYATAVVVKLVRAKIGELAADKLQSALDRAAAVGQAAAGNAVRAGADYLKQQLPGDIRTLKMSDAQVAGLVHAKLTEDAKARPSADAQGAAGR